MADAPLDHASHRAQSGHTVNQPTLPRRTVPFPVFPPTRSADTPRNAVPTYADPLTRDDFYCLIVRNNPAVGRKGSPSPTVAEGTPHSALVKTIWVPCYLPPRVEFTVRWIVRQGGPCTRETDAAVQHCATGWAHGVGTDGALANLFTAEVSSRRHKPAIRLEFGAAPRPEKPTSSSAQAVAEKH